MRGFISLIETVSRLSICARGRREEESASGRCRREKTGDAYYSDNRLI